MGEQRRQVDRRALGRERHLRNVLGQLAAHVDTVERVLGGQRRGRVVVALDERASERALGIARAQRGIGIGVQQQPVPVRQRCVGDRQRLAVHLAGIVGDADVVAVGLRHLAHAVGPGQQGHGEDHLLGLTVGALDVAAQQQVELLVGAAELDVGPHRDRVVALEHRVQQLQQ